MAVAPTPLAAATILLLLRLISADPFSHAPPQRAFVLPLHRSAPKHSRRDLQSPLTNTNNTLPNAQMRLYDDLLLNGYYTTRLWIGTPPQIFALIVDTGSSVTYVPCSTCQHCGNHQDPRFDPELSSTYQVEKCNIDCTCDDNNRQCIYEREYAEMSSSSGVLGEDWVSFGNESRLPPQRATFGCENMETGDIYTQRADGIIGLGSGDFSIVDQLVDKGVISDSFSLCYGGMGVGGGAMVLGAITPPKDMIFVDSNPIRSPYYNINLKEIHVAGKKLDLNPSVFDARHGTVLDSGTTYAYFPEPVFAAFKRAIVKELQSLKVIRGPDPNYKDVCFSGAESGASDLSKSFPTVDMVFGDGQKVSLTPENYLFRHAKVRGAYCLGIFKNVRDPSTLLGGIIVRNTLVMYDRENSRIGFWKTDCSELWERLNELDSSVSIPPPFREDDLTKNASNHTDFVLPDDYQIGQIAFEISFNISYKDLKPRIAELAGYIAPQLDVLISQVHSLNTSSTGSYSVTGWAILPSASSDSIPHTTATNIIVKLADHGMKLPGNFSEYELVRWNVVPKENRKWWYQKYRLIVLEIVVSLVVGVSAIRAWFIFRHRLRALNPYTPVNVATPEQELQPL